MLALPSAQRRLRHGSRRGGTRLDLSDQHHRRGFISSSYTARVSTGISSYDTEVFFPKQRPRSGLRDGGGER